MVKLLFSSVWLCRNRFFFLQDSQCIYGNELAKKDPDHLRFTTKFPKVITHDKRLKDVEKELELFFSSMIYVEDKILALLIQLPPSMGIVEDMTCLGDIILELDKRLCVTSLFILSY